MQYLRAHIELQADRIVSKLRWELDEVPLEQGVWVQSNMCKQLYVETLNAQRHRLRELAEQELLDDELSNKLHHEIDLEESRLHSSSAIHD